MCAVLGIADDAHAWMPIESSSASQGSRRDILMSFACLAMLAFGGVMLWAIARSASDALPPCAHHIDVVAQGNDMPMRRNEKPRSPACAGIALPRSIGGNRAWDIEPFGREFATGIAGASNVSILEPAPLATTHQRGALLAAPDPFSAATPDPARSPTSGTSRSHDARCERHDSRPRHRDDLI